MNCIFIIAGREAVPVRAIPFVDGWRSFTPDEVARGLARRNDSGKLEGLSAHCIASGGSISAMLPKEWDAVVGALDELSLNLKKEGRPRSEWRERSVRELPSHCFVWRDELETAAGRWWRSVHIMGEREGDKALNFAPWMRPGDEEAAFEGIPRVEAASPPVVPESAEKADSAPADSSAPMPDPQGREAEPNADDVQTHQEHAAEMTPTKRAVIIERLGRRYPALESALDRAEEWAKACRVPGRRGWYYLERIEAECRTRYGAAAPARAADLSPAGQLDRISR